jgi:hypothetical protein
MAGCMKTPNIRAESTVFLPHIISRNITKTCRIVNNQTDLQLCDLQTLDFYVQLNENRKYKREGKNDSFGFFITSFSLSRIFIYVFAFNIEQHTGSDLCKL